MTGSEATFERKPLLVIESGRTSLRQYRRDLSQHRDLVVVLATRDLTLRYRQTALGPLWVVLQPLAAAGILSFVFGRIARLPTDGVPAFVFTFAGMMAWSTFANSLTRCANSMVGNQALVAKVFFPRLVLPLSTIPAVLIDFVVTGALLLVMLFSTGLPPDARILLLPLWIFLIVLLGQGIGSMLASLAVTYRDVIYITPVFLQLWFFAGPIAYAVSAVPRRYLRMYYLNPMASPIEAFRWSALGTPAPPRWALLYSAVMAVVVAVAGMVALEKMERRFPDVI